MALLIDNDVAQRVLHMEDAVEAMERALVQLGEGEAVYQPRTDVWTPTAENGDYYCWGSLLGAINDPPRLAMRFKSDILRWEEHDGYYTEEWHNVEPGTFMGFVLLFDTSTGALIGLMNDGVIQHVRVGATAGVACDHLARTDAETVGVIGSGGMAREYVRAFSIVRDLSRVEVYSPTTAHREAFAEEMEEETGVETAPVDSARDVVRGKDIVATCTDSMVPVYDADWMEPGQTLINVHPKEMPQAVYEDADKVLTTIQEGVLDYVAGDEERRDAQMPVEYHRGTVPNPYPTIDELLTGQADGRESDDETILYHNMSCGIQFAAIGNLVHERAAEAELGTAIPLEWFQQRIRN